MRYIFILVVATSILANNALAQREVSSDLVLYGVATRPCGQFLKAHELQNEDYGFYVSWLQGYLSAINIHTVHGRRGTGAKTDVLSMMLWLKAHCSDNPLDNFSLSVMKLTSELK